jgi:simple sugar transport system ATP-binding protein
MNAVEMRGIVKQYPLVRAVDRCDFTLAKGEVHSLLGENGAGKTTLMNILYGITQPDEGVIFIAGRKVTISRPTHAIALRIGMVHQHFMLTPVMSVTENIIVGCEPVKYGFIRTKEARNEVKAMIGKYNFQIDPDEKVENLSVGQQQRVEILKALYRGADILILDEPTAVLTPQEVDELFAVIRELKEAGKSIIIITHKLRETKVISDRVSILRNGRMVATGLATDECDVQDLALMMVGRDVDLSFVRRSGRIGEVALDVTNLNLTINNVKVLNDVAFQLKKGQILGIAGVEGNGQSELIEVLTGLRQADEVQMKKNGKPLFGSVASFLSQGVGHIPEDRTMRGLVLPMNVEENLVLGYHRNNQFSHRGIMHKKRIRDYAEEATREFDIRTPKVTSACSSLSGGNQQKVIIARVFRQDPDVLIAAQPTRGVDVGAQEYIHKCLLDLRDEGKAIILISADLDEIRRLSDRIAVMYAGKIIAEAQYDKWDEATLGLLMAGVSDQKGMSE